jgi:dihydroorotase
VGVKKHDLYSAKFSSSPYFSFRRSGLQYRLQKQVPNINYLMTLYLTDKITPAVVKGAKAEGIVGIKPYPAGVTT